MSFLQIRLAEVVWRPIKGVPQSHQKNWQEYLEYPGRKRTGNRVFRDLMEQNGMTSRKCQPATFGKYGSNMTNSILNISEHCMFMEKYGQTKKTVHLPKLLLITKAS
jgi:hypothetical protein